MSPPPSPEPSMLVTPAKPWCHSSLSICRTNCAGPPSRRSTGWRKPFMASVRVGQLAFDQPAADPATGQLLCIEPWPVIRQQGQVADVTREAGNDQAAGTLVRQARIGAA